MKPNKKGGGCSLEDTAESKLSVFEEQVWAQFKGQLRLAGDGFSWHHIREVKKAKEVVRPLGRLRAQFLKRLVPTRELWWNQFL